MNWPTAPLKQVAPPQASDLQFDSDSIVWHLTLDQIESQSGYIINKKIVRAKDAGTSTYAFDDGNVLYSKLRPYLNKVICPDEPGIATTELVPLRPRNTLLDRRYLTYYLRSNHFLNFANVAVAGGKMPRIIMAKFWNHQIPLPAITEQLHIVELLNQADALRKKRTEADEKASRIPPALFYKMFGDPVVNPKGWEKGSLGEYSVELRYGTSVKCRSERSEGRGMPVLRIPNVINGKIELNDLKYANLPSPDIKKLKLKDGDILFVRTNGNREYVGRCAVFELNEAFLYASYLIRVRLNKELVNPKFIAVFLSTPFGRQAMSPFIRTTAGQSNISQEGLRQISLLIPPMEMQMTFSEMIEKYELLQLRRQHASIKLDSIFKTLLHRAFSGDLTAKWRKANMNELLAEMELQAKALEGN